MVYYTHEVQVSKAVQRTAGIKARDDIEDIIKGIGGKSLSIYIQNEASDDRNSIQKILSQFEAFIEWKKKLLTLSNGDSLVVQCPAINHTVFLRFVFREAREKGVRIVLFLHDLELLRLARSKYSSLSRKVRVRLEEIPLIQECDYIVAHNEKMKLLLIELGVTENKIVSLEIFDYLMGSEGLSKTDRSYPIIIAGTLRKHKANYVYNLPDNCEFNLYGVDYTGVTNTRIHYFGSFPPEELPKAMEGSFGLVWDGDSAETCSGAYGDYLRINNPHKTSLYLACGIPVLIWKEAALADFIKKENCGLTIESLYDIPEILSGLTEEKYIELRENAVRTSKKLRSGDFTKTALSKVLGLEW